VATVGRVVHVASASHLSVADGQLVVSREGSEAGRVPLEDLATLVLDFAPITLTEPLLAALGAAGVALVVCGPRHLPDGLQLPLAGASLHTRILRDQIAASEPRKKRIWQAMVVEKVRAQARTLRDLVGSDHGLGQLARRVGSGDTTNVEGAAARTYFPVLFGRGFARDPELGGVNAALNYGYALIRAAVARAVVGAGLHPALGVHHRNQYDAFALADDAMEPLRPAVDRLVFAMNAREPIPEALPLGCRTELLGLLGMEVVWSGERFPILTALERYAACLRECLGGVERHLRCPLI